MMELSPNAAIAADAAMAIGLLAVDPVGIGGMSVRVGYGPVLDYVLTNLRKALPEDAPMRRVPLQIGDSRLLGGLDLAATLTAGRPVLERGVLAEAHGGLIVLPMAERVSNGAAARLTTVLDTGQVVVERDGFTLQHESRFAVVALDEGAADDERPPPALLDRLGILLDLHCLTYRDLPDESFDPDEIAAARALLPKVESNEKILTSFCNVAAMIGIISLRAPILAMRVARAAAALAGRTTLNEDDAALASRLVLAPRATQMPPMPQQDEQDPETPEPPPETPPEPPQEQDDQDETISPEDLNDIVLEAARAAIPQGLLAMLQGNANTRAQHGAGGRAGGVKADAKRGRPIGTRRGELTGGARLNVVETLRAAAPWQPLRRSQRSSGDPRRVIVDRDDFRITRFKHHSETATLFVVDASGSSAIHRLREAKGAVELLLADCYVRRDQVALISFRGTSAELILPPTRSLARAKRTLSALPGGGGTPMAAAIDAASALADGLRRKGIAPIVVYLTDGRANIARDGSGGREKGEQDALAAARASRAAGVASLLVDISPNQGPAAGKLAQEMGARYLALPRANAATISTAVRIASADRDAL